ncbi:hypothetical protein D3C71_1004830 [compost metagenome]
MKVDVRVSGTAGNALTVDGTNGLFVATPAAGLTAVNSTDSTTIDFTGNGTSGNALVAAVKVSADADNAIESRGDGLYVATVTGGGSGAVTTTDSTSIDFSGTGESGTPLTGSVIVSPTAGNTLTASGNGLYVPTVTVSSTDTQTIDFSGAGTSGSPLTADVKVSATAGNALAATAGGLFATDTKVSVRDEGTELVAAATAINFTGAGVTASHAAGVTTVNIPGGGGGGAVQEFTFRINYTGPTDTAPTVDASTIPAGWSITLSGTTATVTHAMGKFPMYFSVAGYSVAADAYSLRNWMSTTNVTSNSAKTILTVTNLSVATTGAAAPASTPTHTLVNVVFN